ncbi:hypothetical protein [Methanoplanus endosymbiosus]|uniref:Uncharacterized protein n=1 Tax=Methanoplanus endosymbiosus TaxID=33865 RepID=A0A9E7PNP6_9EURY|nr:hypothetical protein [Methanoplanus endosymbiosus]UUX93265.1 hypothetical protein L6E24_03830 [Methanoplanus endosymbiosus]
MSEKIQKNNLHRLEQQISDIKNILTHDRCGMNSQILKAAECLKGCKLGDMSFVELQEQQVNFIPETKRTEIKEKCLFVVELQKPNGDTVRCPAKVSYSHESGPHDLESENLQIEFDLSREL